MHGVAHHGLGAEREARVLAAATERAGKGGRSGDQRGVVRVVVRGLVPLTVGLALFSLFGSQNIN